MEELTSLKEEFDKLVIAQQRAEYIYERVRSSSYNKYSTNYCSLSVTHQFNLVAHKLMLVYIYRVLDVEHTLDYFFDLSKEDIYSWFQLGFEEKLTSLYRHLFLSDTNEPYYLSFDMQEEEVDGGFIDSVDFDCDFFFNEMSFEEMLEESGWNYSVYCNPDYSHRVSAQDEFCSLQEHATPEEIYAWFKKYSEGTDSKLEEYFEGNVNELNYLLDKSGVYDYYNGISSIAPTIILYHKELRDVLRNKELYSEEECLFLEQVIPHYSASDGMAFRPLFSFYDFDNVFVNASTDMVALSFKYGVSEELDNTFLYNPRFLTYSKYLVRVCRYFQEKYKKGGSISENEAKIHHAEYQAVS